MIKKLSFRHEMRAFFYEQQAFPLLQEQIQPQREQGGILLLCAVSRHEKEQHDDEQVSRVQSLGQKPAEKPHCPGVDWLLLPSLRAGSAWRFLPGRTGRRGARGRVLFRWMGRFLPGRRGPSRRTGLSRRRAGLGNAVAAVSTVGLGNIAVIQWLHLLQKTSHAGPGRWTRSLPAWRRAWPFPACSAAPG